MNYVLPRQRDISFSLDALLIEEDSEGAGNLLQENGGRILLGVRRANTRGEWEQNREQESEE